MTATGHEYGAEEEVSEETAVVAMPMVQARAIMPMSDALGVMIMRHGPIAIEGEELDRLHAMGVGLDFRANPQDGTIRADLADSGRNGQPS